MDGKKYKKLRSARLVAGSRRKRQVLADEEPVEQTIEKQLAELSDDQLALLANIVQGELQKYNPNVAPEEYQVVALPNEIFENQMNDGADGVYEDIEIVPQERPTVAEDIEPIVIVPEEELQQLAEQEEPADQQPQIVFVPEEVEATMEMDPEVQEALDELELRERIAELAEILNERANRRL